MYGSASLALATSKRLVIDHPAWDWAFVPPWGFYGGTTTIQSTMGNIAPDVPLTEVHPWIELAKERHPMASGPWGTLGSVSVLRASNTIE